MFNNVIPAWMLDPNNVWYIIYTDGSWREFVARDQEHAHFVFMSEGDHAWTYGQEKPEDGYERR